jgi:enoyl-CoA hydratase/3-hydroxyacyl-CoA dehydrogenase
MGGGSELALACQAILATPAGSMAFPETGIGIIPGLGGMLRTARIIGPELAKYYVFTGATISAQDAFELGIVTKLVEPADMDSAIKELCGRGKPEKYARREISAKFKPYAIACSQENIPRLLSGNPPEGIAEDLAARIAKVIGFKAPLALRMANEVTEEQMGKSIEEAIDVELGRLNEIFSTSDALEGLSSLGRKRPEYKGK